MACTEDFMKGCAGKMQHKTRLSANYFLHNEHSDATAKVYKCKICSKFHIGGDNKIREKKTIKPKKRVNEEQHKRKHKRFKY